MIVIDASITMSWIIADEAREDRDRLYHLVMAQGGAVPAVWALEVANALRTAIRKDRIGIAERDEGLALLSRMRIRRHTDTHEYAWTSILALSDRRGLTPYDAAYLDLALRENLPLATLDTELATAARAEDVETLP